MKYTQLRVKEDTIKWHIKHHTRNGWTCKEIKITPKSQRIKWAILVNEEGTETVTIMPKKKMKIRIVKKSYGVHRYSQGEQVPSSGVYDGTQGESDITGTAESNEATKRSGETE